MIVISINLYLLKKKSRLKAKNYTHASSAAAFIRSNSIPTQSCSACLPPIPTAADLPPLIGDFRPRQVVPVEFESSASISIQHFGLVDGC